ncbi:MAG TPA: hypothetical protein VNZ27_05720 [Rhodanobacter sp.]|nr:hypothetical protein [Rhodanobacter sp.]
MESVFPSEIMAKSEAWTSVPYVGAKAAKRASKKVMAKKIA